MFFTLEAGIIEIIESYHPVPYWKGQFSKEVLVKINKGWKLVSDVTCLTCYSRGERCRYHNHHTGVYEWMSRRQYEFQFHRSMYERSVPHMTKSEEPIDLNCSRTRDYFVDLDETSLTPFEYETRIAMWREDTAV